GALEIGKFNDRNRRALRTRGGRAGDRNLDRIIEELRLLNMSPFGSGSGGSSLLLSFAVCNRVYNGRCHASAVGAIGVLHAALGEPHVAAAGASLTPQY